MQIPEATKIITGIPKGHCPGHVFECQCCYAMGIQPGVGRTDGEAIERLWAFVRKCAASIKEMGPGSRSDTLDDQFDYLNWCKLINFGEFGLFVYSLTLRYEYQADSFFRIDFASSPQERSRNVRQTDTDTRGVYAESSGDCGVSVDAGGRGLGSGSYKTKSVRSGCFP